jgi:AbrB family looped-hinge helix DNA binding protein
MSRTRVTPKYQTTIPRDIRRPLGIRAGDEVEWQLVRQFAVVRTSTRIKDPVRFLTSQTHLDIDAVKLVRKARMELF